MKKCQNPECQKEIPENKAYCNEECLRRAIKLRRQKRAPPFHANYENQLLKESEGLKVELQMSRGPPVRGILVDYDAEYQKVTVKEDLSNQTKLTIVKLSYVSALSVYESKETKP
jgi:hypothetical protein